MKSTDVPNTLIKDLMGKTLDKHFSYTWTTMDYDDITKFSEKFAELLIRECIAITNDQYFAYEAVEALQKHFGVKE